jgi:phosphatidate cytidylyltransferase
MNSAGETAALAGSLNPSNFSVRIASAVSLGLVFLALLHLRGVVPLVLAMTLGMLGLREFLRLTVRSITPLFLLGALLILNLIYVAHHSETVFPWGVAFSLWIAYAVADILIFGADLDASDRFKRVAFGFAGIVFLGLLGYLISFVNVGARIMSSDLSISNPVLLIPMCGSWGYDTGALFSGKLLGQTPFAHSISPRKTWEGVLGGLLSSITALLLVRQVFFQADEVTPPLNWVFVAAALVIGAQFGDLFVSLLKRDAGVKDSGALIPGHGGILDRMDSFLVVLPVAYFSLPFLFSDLSYYQLVGV